MNPSTSRCNRRRSLRHPQQGTCRCRASQGAPVLVGKASAARLAAGAAAVDAVLGVVQAVVAVLVGSEGLAEPVLAPVVSTAPLPWR